MPKRGNAKRGNANPAGKRKPPAHSSARGWYGIVGVTPNNVRQYVVRRRGLEPLHLLRRQDLNLVRLPISPPSLKVKPAIVACLLKSCVMNPRLDALHPYPFEKLRALLASASAQPDGLTPINLSIGEPKHAAPERIAQAIRDHMGGLSLIHI